MKFQNFIRPGLLIGLLAASSVHALDLYIQPDLSTSPIASISRDDSRLVIGGPVLDDAQADAGWKWGEFSDRSIGFVRDAQIGKDLQPVDSAIVHRGASADTPVLTVIQAGDKMEILDTGAWWKIAINKPIPVYFIDVPNARNSAAPVQTQSSAPPPSSGTPAAVVVTPAVDAAPQNQPLPQQSTPANALQDQRGAPSGSAIDRPFEGIFEQSGRRFGLFPPRYPFSLVDAEDNRIAWILVDEIVLPGSLESFIDQEVIVHGTKTYDEKTKAFIINARTMRRKAD